MQLSGAIMTQLPFRTTVDDLVTFCGYLQSKPTGAAVAEAKAVLDATVLDPRKVSAYKTLGLVDDSTGKMRVTELGRAIGRDKGTRKAVPLRSIIADVPAYRAIVDRAVHKGELTVTATEVGAHWHQHFRADASDNDEILNQQAICFFQLAEGADLGRMIVGRKGQPTRFEFMEESARPFVDSSEVAASKEHVTDDATDQPPQPKAPALETPIAATAPNNRIFVTHGKNTKILEQIKRTITSVGLEPVVSVQTETAAKPIPKKVMDDMGKCSAVVIHVGSEAELLDKNGRGWPINPNVLIEIGAAMMHCPGKYVLVVENGIELPSNLQGLYQCRYTGDGLDFDAVMKIQEALRGLK